MSALIPRAVHYAFALLAVLSAWGLVYAWSGLDGRWGSYGLLGAAGLLLGLVLGLWGYYAFVITRKIRQMWSEIQAGKQALDRQHTEAQMAAADLHQRLTALGLGLEQFRNGRKPDMDALAGLLVAATASRHLSIWQLDKQALRCLSVQGAQGLADPQDTWPIDLMPDLHAWLESRQPLIVEDVQSWSAPLPLGRGLLLKAGTKSLALLPLWQGSQVLGCCLFTDTEARSWTAVQDLLLLSAKICAAALTKKTQDDFAEALQTLQGEYLDEFYQQTLGRARFVLGDGADLSLPATQLAEQLAQATVADHNAAFEGMIRQQVRAGQTLHGLLPTGDLTVLLWELAHSRQRTARRLVRLHAQSLLEVTMTGIEDGGRLTRIWLSLSDHSEHYTQHQYFRHLTEHSAALVMVTDLHGRVLYQNPPAGKALGYSAEESIGKNILAYVHQEDGEKLETALKAALSDAAPVRVPNLRLLTRPGQYLPADVQVSSLPEETFAPGLLITWLPVEQYAKAIRQLDQEKAFVEQLLASGEGSWAVLDRSGRLLWQSANHQPHPLDEQTEADLDECLRSLQPRQSIVQEVNAAGQLVEWRIALYPLDAGRALMHRTDVTQLRKEEANKQWRATQALRLWTQDHVARAFTDQQGHLHWANDLFYQWAGLCEPGTSVFGLFGKASGEWQQHWPQQPKTQTFRYTHTYHDQYSRRFEVELHLMAEAPHIPAEVSILLRDVTAVEQHEQALQHAIADWQDTFEQAHTLLLRLDPEGFVHQANPAVRRTLGYALQGQLAGQIHGDDRQDFEQALSKAAQDLLPTLLAVRLMDKDGIWQRLYISLSVPAYSRQTVAPILLEAWPVAGAYHSQEMYLSLFVEEGTGWGFGLTAPSGRWIYQSHALTGWQYQETADLQSLFLPDDRPKIEEWCRNALAGQPSSGIVRHTDGHVWHLQIRRAGQDEILAIGLSQLNGLLTQGVQAQVQAERMQAFAEYLTDKSAMLDAQAFPVFVSKNLRHWLGEQALRGTWTEAWEPAHGHIWARLIEQASATPFGTATAEISGTKQDKAYAFQATVKNFLTHPAVEGYLLRLDDLSDQRRHQDQWQQENARLQGLLDEHRHQLFLQRQEVAEYLQITHLLQSRLFDSERFADMGKKAGDQIQQIAQPIAEAHRQAERLQQDIADLSELLYKYQEWVPGVDWEAKYEEISFFKRDMDYERLLEDLQDGVKQFGRLSREAGEVLHLLQSLQAVPDNGPEELDLSELIQHCIRLQHPRHRDQLRFEGSSLYIRRQRHYLTQFFLHLFKFLAGQSTDLVAVHLSATADSAVIRCQTAWSLYNAEALVQHFQAQQMRHTLKDIHLLLAQRLAQLSGISVREEHQALIITVENEISLPKY